MKRQSLMPLITIVCATAVVLAANNQKCVRYPSNETTGATIREYPVKKHPSAQNMYVSYTNIGGKMSLAGCVNPIPTPIVHRRHPGRCNNGQKTENVRW